LNDWVKALAAQPLMRDLKLTAVSVQNKTQTAAKGNVADAKPDTKLEAKRAVWSFTLVNTEPAPLPPVTSASGAKP
jgi:hypothetical protein